MVKQKVYKGVETLNMLTQRWMVLVEGGDPIKIVDDHLVFKDELGKVERSYRDLTTILQDEYVIYNPIAVGDWVKFLHPTHPEMIYGKITFIEDQKEVTLKGYEGCRFSIDICEKITADEAWEQRYAKVFEWKGRKANELKIGDIVRVSGTNIMATIQKVLDNGLITLDGHGGMYSKKQLMVVAFVDDKIKFPDAVAVDTRNSFQKIIDNEQAQAPQGGIYNG